MSRIFIFIVLISLVACSPSNRDPEVVRGINILYPHSNSMKVVYKSLIRALANQADSTGVSTDLMDQIEKAYYFSMDTSSRDYNSRTINVIDSILRNDSYTVLGEMTRSSEQYKMVVLESGGLVNEIIVLKVSPNEIMLLDIYGSIKLESVLKEASNIQNLINNPLIPL